MLARFARALMKFLGPRVNGDRLLADEERVRPHAERALSSPATSAAPTAAAASSVVDHGLEHVHRVSARIARAAIADH